MKLKKLNSAGQSFINDDFLESSDQFIVNKPEYFDQFDRDIELDELEKGVNEVMEKFAPYDVQIDAFIAPILHRTLKLTRRESADKEIWYYLSCFAFPNFVRHRWKPDKGKITKNRFLHGDFRKHTFYRLWLVAELTIQDNDYLLTQKFLSQSQDFIQQVIERKCSWKRDSIKAIQEVLSDKSRNIYRKTIKRFMQNLTVTVFEVLNYGHIEQKLIDFLPKSENK